MTKRILLVCCAMTLVAVLYAEDAEPVFERFPRGLGFTAGELADIGLSYRS